MLQKLWQDEVGAVLSAELVLVMTLLVIGMIVGLSEVQHAVVTELNDVSDAVGELNQFYQYSGFRKEDNSDVHAQTKGSKFNDTQDACDKTQGTLACDNISDETM